MERRIRVWLNRTYAENVFFIDQLRANPDHRPVHVHATHGDPDSPVLMAADSAALEPDGLSPAEYLEYAVDVCADHGIDVFVPRLHQEMLAANRARFAEVGTVLLAPPAEALAVFRDKVSTYQALAAAGGFGIPPWWRVRAEDDLLAAVEAIEADGGTPCMKPVAGVGGAGFRVITRSPFSTVHLGGYPGPHVPLDLVVQALRHADHPVDWMVMPRLDEPEVSVDCLTGTDGLARLTVGRTKHGRRRGFTLDPCWVEPASRMVEHFRLHHLTNVQFRLHRGTPVVLDVNTRPAGGLHQLAQCGLNVPWAAVRLALGEEPGELTPARLGAPYAVVAGPRPLRPVAIPRPRAGGSTDLVSSTDLVAH